MLIYRLQEFSLFLISKWCHLKRFISVNYWPIYFRKLKFRRENLKVPRYNIFLKHFAIKILYDGCNKKKSSSNIVTILYDGCNKKKSSSNIVTIFLKYSVLWNIELSICNWGINFGFTDEKNIKWFPELIHDKLLRARMKFSAITLLPIILLYFKWIPP